MRLPRTTTGTSSTAEQRLADSTAEASKCPRYTARSPAPDRKLAEREVVAVRSHMLHSLPEWESVEVVAALWFAGLVPPMAPGHSFVPENSRQYLKPPGTNR